MIPKVRSYQSYRGQLEEALVAFDSNENNFQISSIRRNVACYGRYLANFYSEKVYNYMVEDLTEIISQDSYLLKKHQIISDLIGSISGISACNYLRFTELAKENVILTKILLKSIIKIIKDISITNLEQVNFDDIKQEKKCIKNLGYTIRQSFEIIMSFLFLRDNISFSELKPNGSFARELIYYIKRINKNYYLEYKKYFENNFENNFEIRVKPPKLTTKYNMNYEDKDSEFNNMWNEAYCLILYLSGDERANYIKIGDKKDD